MDRKEWLREQIAKGKEVKVSNGKVNVKSDRGEIRPNEIKVKPHQWGVR